MNEATNITQTNYLAGGFQYKNNVLQFFPHAEGYVKHEANNYSYVFNYTDHLGNVRVSYSDIDKNGSLGNELQYYCKPRVPSNCIEYFTSSILEENHYYPFGLKHSGYNMDNSQPNYQYKYNGKELQTELGLNMYDMDMRDYDPVIARWVNPDPIVHFDYSPYSAFDNNPVFYADPSGSDSESFIMDLFNNSASGTIWTNNNGSFSDGNGNSVDCERCKELENKKKKLQSDLKKTNEILVTKTKYVNITRDLTSNGAIAYILKSYILEYKKMTDEQIEYLINNPNEVGVNVLGVVINYELDLAIGDRKISVEMKQKTQEEVNNEILGELSGLSDRIILLANLTNVYIDTATKMMHKTAQTSHAITYKDKIKIKHEISKIDKELKQLSD
ncbi:RHS repeat domain-containing protein [Flavobacterium sp. 316]|uniref:RHS repeat domain-containing protein n=1 Tax=Flavobacterium sp. 316 TaxID=1603293 RepID=UPI000696794B|nr:RHS repeat-associated core domain-containing protein [Flavobacterium sp. 316]